MVPTELVYDHFLAKGGAENVSFLLKKRLNNCTLSTAWADQVLFLKSLNSGELKSYNFSYLRFKFPTMYLALFYLFKMKLSSNTNWLLTGIFSPLVLCFGSLTSKSKIIYFHTFPSFTDLSFLKLKSRYGGVASIFFKVFCWFYVLLLKRAASKADTVFSNSKYVKYRFSQLGIKTKVLYPPIVLDSFKWRKSESFFLSTARLEENKRVRLILEVFSELPFHNLVVIGGGSLEKELRDKFERYKNITFLGWCDASQVADYYSKCHALIYLPINEYFGLAPVEANASGKFVITSDSGGVRETIDHPELGIRLGSLEDSNALKAAIELVASKGENPEKVEFRQAKAKRFEVHKFIAEIESVLR